MNLKQFKYVVTLAQEHNFSAAADVLNITQPSLSQYIKKLEKEVGQALFDRTSGDVRLTDAGRAYIEIGRKMIDLDHQLDQRLSDIAAYKTGTISVGISAHRSAALMPQIVKKFKVLYPGITLRVVEKRRRELIEAAEHGEFDLVITTLPVDDRFDYEMLFVEENVIATTETLHAEKSEDSKFPAVRAEAINGMSFAMLNEDHLMQKELEGLVKAYNIHLEREVECTSLGALVEMVKEGIGSAYIPACLAKDSVLNYYSIKETVPKREIVVMHRTEQYLSEAVLDLKRLLHNTFS